MAQSYYIQFNSSVNPFGTQLKLLLWTLNFFDPEAIFNKFELHFRCNERLHSYFCIHFGYTVNKCLTIHFKM